MSDLSMRRRHVPPILVGALAVVVFFSGFINLLPVGRFYFATIIIDSLFTVLGVVFVVFVFRNRRTVVFDIWMYCWLGLTVVYATLFLFGPEPFEVQALSLRSHVLYIFVAVFIAVVIRSTRALHRLIDIVCGLGAALALFGILQYLFRGSLPEWLLVSGDTRVFSYHGTDIVRSTGLLGNTIIYGNLMLLIYAVVFSRLALKFSWLHLLYAALSLGAIFATFSRAAIAGAVMITFVGLIVSVAYHRSRTVYLRVAVTAGIAACAAVLIALVEPWRNLVMNSFLIRGLFLGGNASVQGSTDGHGDFWVQALELVGTTNHWIGLGIGTQSAGSTYSATNSVITDGAYIALFAEGGLVLLVAYVVFIAVCAVFAVKAWFVLPSQSKFLALGMSLFMAYEFVFAALVNSAFFGKNSFIVFWILFGLLAGLVRVDGTGPSQRHGRRIQRGEMPRKAAEPSGSLSNTEPELGPIAPAASPASA